MATTKEYRDFVVVQLDLLEEITCKHTKICQLKSR